MTEPDQASDSKNFDGRKATRGTARNANETDSDFVLPSQCAGQDCV